MHGMERPSLFSPHRKPFLAIDIFVQPSANGFITAMELCHQRKRVFKISTGSKQFDAILGG
jgi:RecA/RadA recombinase